MHSRLLVYPANQASCEVPVLPAAGAVKPRARTVYPGAVVDDALHHGGQHVGHARIEHLLGVGVVVLERPRPCCRAPSGPSRSQMLAAVGEHRVGAGHLQRRGVIGSQRDGRRCRDAGDARAWASAATLSKPTSCARRTVALFSDMRQRVAGGDFSLVAVVIVAWFVNCITKRDAHRRIVEQRSGSEDGVGVVVARRP